MPRAFKPFSKPFCSPSFFELCQSLKTILPESPPLVSRGDRPLKMTFEDQLNALINHGKPPALPGRLPEFDICGNIRKSPNM